VKLPDFWRNLPAEIETATREGLAPIRAFAELLSRTDADAGHGPDVPCRPPVPDRCFRVRRSGAPLGQNQGRFGPLPLRHLPFCHVPTDPITIKAARELLYHNLIYFSAAGFGLGRRANSSV